MATPVATSLYEPHREFIEAQVRMMRNATAIFQALVDAHGFAGQYNSVKRFVAAPQYVVLDNFKESVIQPDLY
jgi:hypothetical protein